MRPTCEMNLGPQKKNVFCSAIPKPIYS